MTDKAKPGSDDRHRRLGEALRENLRRRKQQARGRAGAGNAAEVAPEGGENPPEPPLPRRDRPD